MATNQIFPMNALKSALKASRTDLAKLRAINEELSRRIAAISDKSQFNANYIATEVAKLREDARQQVTNYLTQEKTFPRLKSIQEQKTHWTPRAYLLRGLAVEPPLLEKYNEQGNTTALLKAVLDAQRTTNALLSVSTLPVSAVAETFDAALLAGDMALAAVSYAALVKAGEGGDDTARRAASSIEAESFPAVKEAGDLIAEARKLDEYLGYTVRSITTGSDDVGIRSQEYADIEAAREQGRDQERTQRQNYAIGAEVRQRVA